MSNTHDTGPSRWSVIYEAMTGATSAHSEHHEDAPGTHPDSLKAGHEPDRFDTTGIIAVPFLVVIVTGAVYVLVTFLFSHFNFGQAIKDSSTNLQAATEQDRPYNERVSRISSSDPHAAIQEPRLEQMQSIDTSRGGKPTDDPAFLRSFPKSDNGNTTLVTPQDLYPDRYVDPTTGTKLLAEYAYVNKEKTVARIPVGEAIKMLAGKLPAKKSAPNSSTTNNPKHSNGGQAIETK